jgi:hypothetical protein
MQIYTRQHGRARAAFYGCPRSRVDRCTNTLLVRMEAADAAALGIMSEDVLDDAVINRALDKLLARFNGPEETDGSRRTGDLLGRPPRGSRRTGAGSSAEGRPFESYPQICVKTLLKFPPRMSLISLSVYFRWINPSTRSNIRCG